MPGLPGRRAMFMLDQLPDDETLRGFARRFPGMEMDTTAACLRLLKAASRLLLELDRHFAAFDSSQARFLALVVLERTPGHEMMPSELSKEMGISKKNTTRLLNFMEVEKLVSRAEHSSDRRSSIIRITARGQGLLDRMLPGYYQIFNTTLRGLDHPTKARLIGLLDNILLSTGRPARTRPDNKRKIQEQAQ